MREMYDVVVVGAGPGGSAAAHYLAQGGVDVLLLDRSDFPRDKTCGDGLTPRALAVLHDMGLLDPLCASGYHINEMALFAPNGRATHVTIPRSTSIPDHMLIVQRRVLDDTIRQRAVSSGADFASPVNVTAIERCPDGVVVVAQHHGEPLRIRASIAIIATGASLRLLEQIGVLTKPPLMMVAMRAYFEGVAGLTDRVDCHFDGIPLPGYGWVFPLSGTAANVGIGFLPSSLFARLRRTRSRGAFDAFLRQPLLKQMLATAQRLGPIKGYPIRVDFDRSRTFSDRILLVGEAAGLVNPLTGEGIDYALESGKIAAEYLLSS